MYGGDECVEDDDTESLAEDDIYVAGDQVTRKCN